MRAAFYAGLLGMRVRTSLTTGMQYRWNFLIDAAMSILWAGISMLPLWVIGGVTRAVEGWTYPQMIVVTGWFILLKGLIDGAINPSLMAIVEHIRQGTLDFVLLKPADAQFLISTERFDVMKMGDLIAGALLVVYAFGRLGYVPGPGDIALALVLLVAAAAVLYSVWLLVVCVAFWVVRLDNLAYLFMSIFDFARWPVDIFRGPLRWVFTIAIPLAIMTTYPARALLGTLQPEVALGAIGGSAAFFVASRMIWKRALGRYTSASS